VTTSATDAGVRGWRRVVLPICTPDAAVGADHLRNNRRLQAALLVVDEIGYLPINHTAIAAALSEHTALHFAAFQSTLQMRIMASAPRFSEAGLRRSLTQPFCTHA
jgi:hypothetical protein